MSNQLSIDVFEAAAAGDLEGMKSLGRIHLEAKNDRGWTPLMFAARYGHAGVVEYLLADAKVDSTAVNKDGKTAAELAEFWGATDAVAVFDRLAPNKKTVQHSVGSPFASDPMSAGAGIGAGGQQSGIADWWKKRTVHETKPLHFTGATHNRLSFLRTDEEYLKESLKASSTRFILLADHGVMFKSTTKHLAFASYEDIKHLVGSDPLSSLPEGLALVFLGADETESEQPQQEGEVLVRGRRGAGYWALDLSAKGPRSTQELRDSIESFMGSYTEKHGHYMAEMRPAAFGLSFPESALLAQARSVVDWNKRNQFCAGCGRKNMSLEGGHKRACPTTIAQDGQEVPSDCLAHKGVQNFTYPRTDPVVIVCAISSDGERVLLGRQAIWPKGMYSCLAGFVEPGESLEEAARREVKEESGIRLGHVMYHSSQPWPFPNSLMIGCHAEALNEDPDVTKEDKELEDARWFTRPQILDALKGSRGALWGKPSGDDTLRLPPATAIAHHILRAWATQEGEVPQPKM
ncbi:NUDIX hydrolase domain-like protein [Gamsiella multidivaricata]|uniref:NUDIX hydrolase domain-like protein n=1 Tax=Gamsiella multidivaricata TaxID=101098 RepID=UPI0022206838|nr:NUDIX hydrolase domain-like protein [Gamsiella multidivaricata]KAG0369233.1 Peroxisomal NADH pyrophosphatase nudt12 [Gamsiella multidivaricata]KAI7825126.1 NUDIX hydrolase domain-like protein [Gamsiella multidivaricata]